MTVVMTALSNSNRAQWEGNLSSTIILHRMMTKTTRSVRSACQRTKNLTVTDVRPMPES
jgi:hypothetical protein